MTRFGRQQRPFLSLLSLFEQSTPSLRPLLRNIFNLHLLADLLSTGVVRADLAAIRTSTGASGDLLELIVFARKTASTMTANMPCA